MQLRPYQLQCVETLWNSLATSPNVLCVMATGGGKTECFIELVRRANVRTAVLVGRIKLVEQTVRRISAVLPDVGVWSAAMGEKRIAPVTVVSIHSADGLTIDGLKLIICDEAHNLNDGRYARFLSRHPGAKLVGFTATPWRDGVEIFGEGRTFNRIHYRRGLKEIIADGFLVPPVTKAMPNAFETKGLTLKGDDFKLSELIKLTDNKDKIRAQVKDAMPRLEGRAKVAWMCASIEHAERVAEEIGSSVAIIHSKRRDEENAYAIECFERGHVRHMVSVMMLSEGYDFPAIDAIVLMRPTRSPTLYVQTVGRALRPYEGKENALVLDYGEVVKNCGPVDAPFTREFRKRAEKEPLLITVRVCPKCLSYVARDIEACPDCGHEMRIERDPLKNLTREAAIVDLMSSSAPERLQVLDAWIGKHRSRNGNDCIKLSFKVDGRVWPVNAFGSEHPFSWGKFSRLLYEMTPFRFNSWRECFDACEQLVLETPEFIIVKKENGFDAVQGILGRAPDSDIPF